MPPYGIIDLVAPVVFVASIVIAAVPWSDPTLQEVSNLYPTTITPDGYAFSIWGLIYAAQALSFVVLLIRTEKYKDDNIRVMGRMGWWWTLGWGFAIAWVIFFVQNTDNTVIAAAIMLILGCVSFTSGLFSAVTLPKDVKFQRRFVMFNTALVAAWTTAAACLSVMVAVSKNSPGVNLRLVALIILGGAVLLIAVPMALWSGSVAYCLVFVWALVGAAFNDENEKNEPYLWGGVALFGLLALVNIGRWIRHEFVRSDAYVAG